jgi:hypothetical protein
MAHAEQARIARDDEFADRRQAADAAGAEDTVSADFQPVEFAQRFEPMKIVEARVTLVYN